MARRIINSMLFACILLACSNLHAQGGSADGDGRGLIPTLFSFKRSGVPGRTQYGGPTDPAAVEQCANEQPYPVPGVPYYGPDGLVTSRVPIQPDWVEPSPLEATLLQVFHRSYYRLEWLQWTVGAPGRTLLGAPLNTTLRPQDPFPVFDQQIPANFIGDATVPVLDIDMRQVDGLRGTIGVPTMFGAVEASFFALNQANDSMSVPDLMPHVEVFTPPVLTIFPGRFAGTSLFENGGASDVVELYNRSFEATYTSDVLGAEANVILTDVIDFGMPGGLEIQPTFGFRYLQVQEELQQTGQFEDVNLGTPVLTSTINSSTNNNFFGPSIGTRVELQHEWFTLGVHPKVTFATDAFRARVYTENFRSLADGIVTTEDRSVYFAPITEVQAYAHIHLTHSISLSVGYNLLYMSRITRPHDNIYYNDTGVTEPPGLVVKPKSTYLDIQGFNLGLEILLP